MQGEQPLGTITRQATSSNNMKSKQQQHKARNDTKRRTSNNNTRQISNSNNARQGASRSNARGIPSIKPKNKKQNKCQKIRN